MILHHVIGTAMLAVGVFFLVVAAIGFIRLPDVFCRLHITGVIDTLGAPLIMLGAAFYVGPSLVAGKLVLGIAFIMLTSPLVGHLLARAALEAGHQPGVIEDPEMVSRRYGQATSAKVRAKAKAEADAAAPAHRDVEGLEPIG